MPQPYQPDANTPHPDLYKLIRKVRNVDKRNLLRGYCTKPAFSDQDIEIIRRNNSLEDSVLVGALLRGKHGLLNAVHRHQPKRRKTSADLFKLTTFPPLAWRNELCYTAGYINSDKARAVKLLSTIQSLAQMETMSSEEVLDRLLQLALDEGASNYLSYKLAYLRNARDIPPALASIIARIETEMGHRDNPGLHFSALENLSSKLSLFVLARRRLSALSDRIDGDFRQFISLSNFIPTPLDEADAAAFLLRATESSLIDTLYAVVTIFNLDAQFDPMRSEFENRLEKEVLHGILSITAGDYGDCDIVTDFYSAQSADSYPSLDWYRTCAAFLERPQCAMYRHRMDKVIGPRLLAEIDVPNPKTQFIPAQRAKELLLAPHCADLDEDLPIRLDEFYRTYVFLMFINCRTNILALGQEQIKYIFERTANLETLLTQDEMRTLYLTAPQQAKGLVSVLALALYRKKSVDPDIDFEFRADFIEHINNAHGGSILGFITDLLTDSPAVANYIVASLDEVTLQKMYTLVTNASEALNIRRDILKAVGQRLNRIEYIIEAEAITTRSKVASLHQYFDASRMYVDSVAMKKWLDGNPSISTEQYRTLYRHAAATEPASGITLQDNGESLVQQLAREEYLVQQIAKEAFEQFCLNSEFGIESYLGRRIRHNTLQGVMRETVDAVLKKHEHQAIATTAAMRGAIQAWLALYNSMIEKLRRDRLQFKTTNSLFVASLDLMDAATNENIRTLATSLRVGGASELLNDLVIAFCWRQIAPQLDNASRFIKTTLLGEANGLIDQYFARPNGPAPEGRLKSDLHDAVNEIFKKVAGWFQVPQTGFVDASVRELCHIILIDLNKATSQIRFDGNRIDSKYTGISVHRIYDCLAVLLQNAIKHGREDSSIVIDISGQKHEDSSMLDNLTIRISSVVVEQDYISATRRIKNAIESEETGVDMVTEGYTGIKKVKVITRACEGLHTVHLDVDALSHEVTLQFSLHAETLANEAKGSL